NKVGRGSANIKVKVRNIKSGTIVEKSYINGAKVQDVPVSKKDMQFLYKDDEFVYFMDPHTYEQITISLKGVPDHIYLKEGESFNISFLKGEPLSVAFPPKMTFKVVETVPGVRGNSTTNVFKEAILDNGLKTKVPLFIDTGEFIKVDTRTGAYAEKAQQ
ncbi:MAG TPA: elongation factor P, partial [Patescibacteria group bacterium]|nr:elongation factor P [Patescibacteria group bacterium]